MSQHTGSPSRTEGSAVVIGGSMAGLLAARVLSDHFEQVTLIERDAFPEGPEFRKGVPQSRHLHVLLARGRQIAERLFPGIGSDLLAAGAEPVDIAESGYWLTPAGLAPRFRSGFAMLTCSRNLIEWAVRRRVGRLDNVCFLERTAVTGLLPTPGNRIAGIRMRPRNEKAAPEQTLRADLIVDASGRGSKAPRWLSDLGHQPPQETTINAHPGYATRIYQRPRELPGDWKIVFLQAAPPEYRRGGYLFPVEGGRWVCSLVGLGGDYAPTDEADFLEFARSLRSPILHDAIKDLEPASPIYGYREVANRRLHYGSLQHRPSNFLVTGDAACSFNPVYGQGMSAAAIDAEVLESCLAQTGNGARLSATFQKRLAKATDAPWMLATGEDLRVNETEGRTPGLSTRLLHGYMDRVLALSMEDLAVRRTFLEVFGMTRQPSALFDVSIVAKALRQSFRRENGATTPTPAAEMTEAA